MSGQSQLLTRAARLFSLALKARERGHLDYAERLTQRASEILDLPTALERLGTQNGERFLGRPTRTARPGRDRSGSTVADQLSPVRALRYPVNARG
jgi:hypothetical protein